MGLPDGYFPETSDDDFMNRMTVIAESIADKPVEEIMNDEPAPRTRAERDQQIKSSLPFMNEPRDDGFSTDIYHSTLPDNFYDF